MSLEEYSWRNSKIIFAGRTLINVTEFSYKRGQEVEVFHGNDGEVSGYGVGNISGDGKIVVSGQEYEKIIDFAVAQGYDILKMPALPLIFDEKSPDLPTITHVLSKVKFNEESFDPKNGDKRLLHQLPFKIVGPAVKYKS